MGAEEVALEVALKNALEHGEAREGPVLGGLMGEVPELSGRVEEARSMARRAVDEANSMSEGEVEKALRELAPSYFEEEPEERGLPDLPGDLSDVKLRFAPNPSGPLHLGHARAAVLNDRYAERYDGAYLLRIEDTDPARVDPSAYEMIDEDLAWLGVVPDERFLQSDRLEVYHDRTRELIERGAAYVCTCPEEEFRELREGSTPCPCRDLSVEENLERFGRMFDDFDEGDAVVRIKTDLDHEDPAMRDFPAMRISEAPHPRVDARVYPLMNLSVAVDDHLLGVTHVIRGKDHIANTRRQRFIYRHFGWEPPEYVHHGHLDVEGVVLSTSSIRQGISEGRYTGWDDPAIGTLRALRRRGIRPEAVEAAVLSHGISEADAEFSWSNLYAENRDAIDDSSDRYFFVPRPTELLLEAPASVAKPPLHPDHPERGSRRIEVEEDPCLLLSSGDVGGLSEGDRVRLKDLYNVEVTSTSPLEGRFMGDDLSILEDGVPIIQWVPRKSPGAVVLKPDGEDPGNLEEGAAKLDEGSVIQFERYGFCRLDSEEPLRFCLAHR